MSGTSTVLRLKLKQGELAVLKIFSFFLTFCSSRLAGKHLAKEFVNFAGAMWRKYGARLFAMVAFENPEGQLVGGHLDYNENFGGGKDYVKENDKFEEAGITPNDWLMHNQTYYSPARSNSNNPQLQVATAPPKISSGRPSFYLARNKYGEPILPDMTKVNRNRDKVSPILRSFLNIHWGTSILL